MEEKRKFQQNYSSVQLRSHEANYMFKKATTTKSKEPGKIVREVSVEDVDTSTDAVTPYIVIKKPMTKPLPDYDEEPVAPL